MAAHHFPLSQASTYVAKGQSRFEGDLEKEGRSCRPALALWKVHRAQGFLSRWVTNGSPELLCY